MILRRISLDLCRNIRRLYHHNGNVLKLNIFQDFFPSEHTKELQTLLQKIPQRVYAGFDPTANSLHVGNLLILIGLLHCQRAGHQAIALLGGATGQIGDPSGRTTERQLLTSDDLEENLARIKSQIVRIFKNHEKHFWTESQQRLQPHMIVNNASWYNKISSVQFISQIGRHFRMGDMLSRTSVQSRLKSETGMSFTEFTYQVCQAYDWLHLFREYDCRFQLGGSDQMGNITSGHDLISRATGTRCFGLTMPLITNEEGDKFGKSAGQAVWLDAAQTSPFDLYQFFLRQPDAKMEELLRLFTFLSAEEQREVLERHRRAPELREPQRVVAEQVTKLTHGEEGLRKAQQITAVLYKGDVNQIAEFTPQEMRDAFEGAPYREILLEAGLSVLDLALKAKCFNSEKDAIRIISAGGFHVNQKKTTNVSEVIVPGIHILRNGLSLLRVGKKNFYIVKFLS